MKRQIVALSVLHKKLAVPPANFGGYDRLATFFSGTFEVQRCSGFGGRFWKNSIELAVLRLARVRLSSRLLRLDARYGLQSDLFIKEVSLATY